MNCVNVHEHVVIHPINDDKFKDYDAILDKFYQCFDVKKVGNRSIGMKKWHIYEAELAEGCSYMTFKDSKHEKAVTVNHINLRKGQQNENNQ